MIRFGRRAALVLIAFAIAYTGFALGLEVAYRTDPETTTLTPARRAFDCADALARAAADFEDTLGYYPGERGTDWLVELLTFADVRDDFATAMWVRSAQIWSGDVDASAYESDQHRAAEPGWGAFEFVVERPSNGEALSAIVRCLGPNGVRDEGHDDVWSDATGPMDVGPRDWIDELRLSAPVGFGLAGLVGLGVCVVVAVKGLRHAGAWSGGAVALAAASGYGLGRVEHTAAQQTEHAVNLAIGAVPLLGLLALVVVASVTATRGTKPAPDSGEAEED